jgi:hypothetical protein
MQQTRFAMERDVPAAGQHPFKGSPVMFSTPGLWRQGKRDEVFGMIENCLDSDASLFYLYAGLKGLWMAERTLGEALSYLRVAAEMKTDDPNLQPVLEEAGQNLVMFSSALSEAITSLGAPTNQI